MHRFRLAIAASLALLGAPALAQDAPTVPIPPADPAYSLTFATLFNDTCYAHRSSIDEIRSAALGAGWVDAAANPDPTLRHVYDQMAALTDRPEIPGWKLDYIALSRDVAGQPLFLIATVATSNGSGPAVGCYIYNFAATAPLDTAVIKTTLAFADDGARQEQLGGQFQIWTTTDPEGQAMMGFIPTSSPAATQTGTSGVAMNVNTFLAQ